MTTTDLTAATLNRFLSYARDAGNWGGTPLVGGNVGGDPSDKGYLLHMKQAGLVKTFVDDGDVWISFTAAGHALAAAHGVTI